MVGCIKMPLGTEVGFCPGIVLDGDPDPPRKGAQQPPHFSTHFAVARSTISATAERLFFDANIFAKLRQLTLIQYPKSYALQWARHSSKSTPFSWSICTSSNTWFLGSTRLSIRNGISIGAAVFAQLTAERTYTLTL